MNAAATSSPDDTRQEFSQADAANMLRKVRQVYANATSYSDNTTVVFYAVPRATGTERTDPFIESYVAFERPNQLHVAYTKYVASPQEEGYEVVCDGLSIRSSADELPDQIHEAVAPVRLSADNFIPEPALRGAILENSIENSLPQLAMLLSDDFGQEVFPGVERLRQLSDSEIEGSKYHRLELAGPAGRRVLWIDPQQFTIRRMELPIEGQRKELNPGNQYSTVSVWIDFEGVKIDGDISPQVFEMEVPDGARRVRRFIPSPPAGPPEYLGKPVGEFAFQSLDGETMSPESLAGKVTVLDFWTTQCPPCRTQTPVLNEVYEHFRESEDFSFLAVSLDSRVVPNETVAKTLASWGGAMPIVRDRDSSSVSTLNVRQTPSLLAFDQDGRVQSFQIGAHRSPAALIAMIQRMLDGEDLVAADREKHAGFVAKYEAALDAAEIRDSILEVEIVRPEVPERKLPSSMKLAQRWQTPVGELARPGALLMSNSASGESLPLLVIDDGQSIVELSERGEVVGRHELPDHPERDGGFLRSWRNEKGEQWTLASGAGWQQVYVFDKEWQQVLAFPDEQHSGIGDVLFVDLTGSGTPVMYVGYWGGLGVQGGTLDGRRLWSNRRLDHVLQIGVGPQVEKADDSNSQSRTVWCTSTRGTVLQMGADGKSMKERYIPGQALMYMATHPGSKQQCGLSVGRAGEYTAAGFDDADQLLWEYELPAGEYSEHLPRVQSVEMPDGSSAWMIVSANGSMHWLDISGELLARFDYGEILTGIAMQRLGEQTMLFVSTAKQVTAWQVEPVAIQPVATKPNVRQSEDSEISTQPDSEPAVED